MNIKIMYAIAFDLDVDALKKYYHATNYPNAYKEVRDFLAKNDFHWQQGSLYYGDMKTVKMGTPFLVIRKLSKEFSWFKDCVSDARVLAILEQDDLKPHLE
jgi:virulence-associated protein VapD